MVEKSYESILPNSRRNNSYARRLDRLFSNAQLKDFSTAKGIEYDALLTKFHDDIFQYTSYDGSRSHMPSKDLNKNHNHPKGSKCNFIKSTQRYCWLNFVTFIFNTRGCNVYTIENRSHAGSMNYRKIKNWLKIFIGFVALIDNHKQFIKENLLNPEFNLENVINKVYKRSANELITYIRDRQDTFRVHGETVDHNDSEVFETKSIKQLVGGN